MSVYAEDAAGNACDPVERVWVVDTIAPTIPAVDGAPADGAVTQQTDFSFTAASEDATALTYVWALNGGDETEKGAGEAFSGSGLADGGYTVTVYARDEAGNVSEATNRTWTVDTTKPTDMKVWGLPISDDPEVIVVTNGCDFAFEASATDASALKFIWATNGVAVTDCTSSNFVGQVGEGTNTVSVYAKDAAGNACDPVERMWVVDITPPTNVVFSTELPANKVINLADVTPNGFKVEIGFSEDVTGFTAASVTIANGNGAVTSVETNSAAAYTVCVMPDHDGPVSLKVEAGAVKDLAGNDNLASEVLERMCDITPPTIVSIESEMSEYPFSPVDLDEDNAFEVTIAFSEPVTNFTKSSVAVVNGTVISVSPSEEVATTYTVKVTPNVLDESEYDIAIGIASGAVWDLAGNGNEESEPLVCKYDYKPPTLPVVSGTPANGATIRGVAAGYSLIASGSTDTNGVSYCWQVLVDEEEDDWDTIAWETNMVEGVVTEPGVYTMRVFAMDGALNPSEVVVWSWTLEPGGASGGVPFGDSVQLVVSTPEVTNVVFEAVDFHPGETSTFALREFEPINSQETAMEITDLRMRFIVGTNLLDAIRWPVKVESSAGYTNGTLTVRILGDKTTDENTGKPYEKFFVFGIDNQDLE